MALASCLEADTATFHDPRASPSARGRLVAAAADGFADVRQAVRGPRLAQLRRGARGKARRVAGNSTARTGPRNCKLHRTRRLVFIDSAHGKLQIQCNPMVNYKYMYNASIVKNTANAH